MSNFIHCDECPWFGKCEADECCWLDVEWKDDEQATTDDEKATESEPELPEAA